MSYYSKYYDALFDDAEGISQYVSFIQQHNAQSPLLDCACGSGALLLELQKVMECDGLDIDEVMLQHAKEKGVKGQLYLQDMTKPFDHKKNYATITCVGDSLNYLKTEKAFKGFLESSYQSLNIDGRLIFDMHTQDRLSEFEEMYVEEAIVEGMAVTWTVESINDTLLHQFLFYDNVYPTIEEVQQKVFDVVIITELLQQVGFEYEIYTDFDKEGIVEGEKYFFVCRKKESK